MVKARGKVTRSNVPKAAYARIGEPEVEIAVWTPRPNGEPPYEQVHFIMKLPGLGLPLIMRFKSPDTLGFFIEELAHYRRVVWPDAEPIKLEGEGSVLRFWFQTLNVLKTFRVFLKFGTHPKE